MDDQPAANSGNEDDDDNDEEEVDPDGGNGRITSASPSTVALPPSNGLPRSRWRKPMPPARIEQLGRFRPAYGYRKAAAVERYASRPPDAEPLV